MKKIGIRIIILICIISFGPHSVIAWDWGFFKKEKEAVKEVDKKEITYKIGDKIAQEVIEQMIAEVATGTKAYQMSRTIFCESGFYNIQSRVINKQGEQEDSWGISQIHLPSHPKVTQEQALDPEFSINFMNDNWDRVAWYGYNRKLDKCN